MKILISFLLFSTAIYGQQHRWSTKTLTDGFKISGEPRTIKVADLAILPIVPVGTQTHRLEREEQFIKITGKIVKKIKEPDGDIHIEIMDGSSVYSLPCESVSPKDNVAKSSPYIKDFISVREVIESAKIGDTMEVSGLEFQDEKHGKLDKRMFNFLEIHPITSCRIITGK